MEARFAGYAAGRQRCSQRIRSAGPVLRLYASKDELAAAAEQAQTMR